MKISKKSLILGISFFSAFGLGAWFGGQKSLDILSIDIKRLFSKIDPSNATEDGLDNLKGRVNASIRFSCKEATIEKPGRISNNYSSLSKLQRILTDIETLFDEAPTQVSQESLKNTKDVLTAITNSAMGARLARKNNRQIVEKYERATLLSDLEKFFLNNADPSQTRESLELLRDKLITECFSACQIKKDEIQRHSGYSAIPNSAGFDVPESSREYCSICYQNFYDKRKQPESFNFVPQFGCKSGALHVFCKDCTKKWLDEKGRGATCPCCRAPRLDLD